MVAGLLYWGIEVDDDGSGQGSHVSLHDAAVYNMTGTIAHSYPGIRRAFCVFAAIQIDDDAVALACLFVFCKGGCFEGYLRYTATREAVQRDSGVQPL